MSVSKYKHGIEQVFNLVLGFSTLNPFRKRPSILEVGIALSNPSTSFISKLRRKVLVLAAAFALCHSLLKPMLGAGAVDLGAIAPIKVHSAKIVTGIIRSILCCGHKQNEPLSLVLFHTSPTP